MTAWATRLVTALTLFAVTGAPAVLSACMTSCMPGTHQAGMMSEHADSSHVHQAPDAPQMDHSQHAQPPVPTSDARALADCKDCCPHKSNVSVGTVGSRAEAQDAVLPGPVADQFRMLALLGARQPSFVPGVKPPSPVHAPLILRI